MSSYWSPAQLEVLQGLVKNQMPYREIGRLLGRTPKSIERAVARYRLRFEDEGEMVAELAGEPFAVPIQRGVRSDGKVLTAVLFGDTHSAYIDEDAWGIALAIAKDFDPDVVVHMGDVVDCWTISKFDKDPMRRLSLQDDIKIARQHLWQMSNAVPEAERYVLSGNHDDRLRRLVWTASQEVQQVLTLDDVQEALEWRKLLRLDEIGVEWVPLREQTHLDILPKFLLKHGDKVRQQSGYSARAEHEQYGMSGASGHTHRLGMYMIRDHNGSHMWWESGCLCQLNPEYTRDPNWQQGMLLATFDTETAAPNIDPVFIHKGVATALGNVYRV
jgi:predicted phosphodiesterase